MHAGMMTRMALAAAPVVAVNEGLKSMKEVGMCTILSKWGCY